MSSIADLLAIVNSNPTQTLDELIRELDTSTKRFVISEDVFYKKQVTLYSDDEGELYSIIFEPKVDGQFQIYEVHTGNDNRVYFDVKKNDEMIFEKLGGYGGSENYELKTLDIKKDDKIEIVYRVEEADNLFPPTLTFELRGKVIPYGYFSITE